MCWAESQGHSPGLGFHQTRRGLVSLWPWGRADRGCLCRNQEKTKAFSLPRPCFLRPPASSPSRGCQAGSCLSEGSGPARGGCGGQPLRVAAGSCPHRSPSAFSESQCQTMPLRAWQRPTPWAWALASGRSGLRPSPATQGPVCSARRGLTSWATACVFCKVERR